jgi:hypothetical protein
MFHEHSFNMRIILKTLCFRAVRRNLQAALLPLLQEESVNPATFSNSNPRLDRAGTSFDQDYVIFLLQTKGEHAAAREKSSKLLVWMIQELNLTGRGSCLLPPETRG